MSSVRLSLSTLILTAFLMLASTTRCSTALGATSLSLADTITKALAGAAGGSNEHIVVQLAAADYRLIHELKIDGSLLKGRSLLVRGSDSGETRIMGSIRLNPERNPPATLGRCTDCFEVSLDDAILARLNSAGVSQQTDPSRILLFEGDRELTPNRWPDNQYARANEIRVTPQNRVAITRSDMAAPVASVGSNAWIAGYFETDYYFRSHPVSENDGYAIQFDGSGQPQSPKPGFRYFLYNLATDQLLPGHFFLDWAAKRIIVNPFKRKDPIELALTSTLIDISNSRDVRLEHIQFKGSTQSAIRIVNSQNITLSNSAISDSGAQGVEVRGGENDSIERCVIYNTGDSAVILDGGDRQTLTFARHSLTDSIIVEFSQNVRTSAAVALSGVGQSVTGNFIGYGPFSAIIFEGNEHTISGNEITRVVTDVSDFGAIYSGRDWTERGTKITQNYLHDISPASGVTVDGGKFETKGIYLDDLLSGQLVMGNLFYNVMQPVFVNGGRDNIIRDNVFISSLEAPITVTAWGLTGWMDWKDPRSRIRVALNSVPIHAEAYVNRYPTLEDILSANPGAPIGNIVESNSIFGEIELRIDDAARPFVTVGHNEVFSAMTDLSTADVLNLKESVAVSSGLPPAKIDRRAALADLPYARSALNSLSNEVASQ